MPESAGFSQPIKLGSGIGAFHTPHESLEHGATLTQCQSATASQGLRIRRNSQLLHKHWKASSFELLLEEDPRWQDRSKR
jgi:hypothetical protein